MVTFTRYIAAIMFLIIKGALRKSKKAKSNVDLIDQGDPTQSVGKIKWRNTMHGGSFKSVKKSAYVTI